MPAVEPTREMVDYIEEALTRLRGEGHLHDIGELVRNMAPGKSDAQVRARIQKHSSDSKVYQKSLARGVINRDLFYSKYGTAAGKGVWGLRSFRKIPMKAARGGLGSVVDIERPLEAASAVVEEVPIEEQWTERAFMNPHQAQTEAERREATLVGKFRDFLCAQGAQVTRLKIIPKGEANPLFSDLYVRSWNLLVEAKGTVDRSAIRMALGQLLDYKRFVEKARIGILVPTRPCDDLVELVLGCGFEFFWQDCDGFFHVTGVGGDPGRKI